MGEPALAFERTGRGPGVVLLHSLGGDRTAWREEAPRLAARHTVLNVELPGHGASPAPERVDFARIAEQVTALIRAEGLAPAVVMGHSLGGTLAAWAPFADAGAVRAVLVVDSGIAPLPWPEGRLSAVARALRGDFHSGLRHFFAPITSGPEQLERIVGTAARVPVETFLGYLSFAAHHTILPQVPRLRVPVGLIASSSWFTRPERKEELAEGGFAALEDFTYWEMPQTRHFVQWDAPERFAEHVDAFLASLDEP